MTEKETGKHKTHRIIVIAERETSALEMHSIDRQTHIIGLLELDYDVTVIFEKIKNAT